MPETITFHALDLAGETGLKLYLRKNDGTLLNTDGDAFADLGSSGVFTTTLDESRVGLGSLHARVCDGTETAENSVHEEFLPETVTVIGSAVAAVLDSGGREAIAAKVDEVLSFAHDAGSWAGGGEGGLTEDQDTMLTEIHEAIYPDDPEAPELVITPGTLNETTGYAVVRNADNSPAANVTVYAWLATEPNITGEIFDGSTRVFTSASNGLVQVPNLVKGGTYYFAAGANTSKNVRFRIPLNAVATHKLPTLIRSSE